MALPSGYQEVEYIESTGTQWLQIWTSFKTGYKTVVDFQMTATWSDQVVVWVYKWGVTKRYWIDAWQSNFKVITWWSDWSNTISEDTNRHLFTIDKSTVTVDGTNYSCAYSDYTYTTWLWVFTYLHDGQTEANSKNKLYKLDIYDENWVHIHDLIPCYRKSDDEIWLYDLVNDTFYTNQWTGTFAKWPDVLPTYKLHWAIQTFHFTPPPKIPTIDFLLVAWWGGWGGWWFGWWWWAWWALQETWYELVKWAYCVVVWAWWGNNTSWWDSCFGTSYHAIWWWRGSCYYETWWTWWSWGWGSNCPTCWWSWTTWQWYNWWNWHTRAGGWWWGWAWWAWANWAYFVWWNWWIWIISDISWESKCYAWWWWWAGGNSVWQWSYWWWRWWGSCSGLCATSATTYWSWWWGGTSNNWASWCQWVFIVRYPTVCWYSIDWWCKYECWDYTIHCFTSDWTLCVY